MAEESSESRRRDEHGRFTSGDDDDTSADENGGSTGGEGDTGEAFSGARREKAGRRYIRARPGPWPKDRPGGSNLAICFLNTRLWTR